MDEVKKIIEKRKSIRKYKDKEISDDIINKIIDVARLAPSGNNAQPSEYIVIKDKKTIEELRENSIFPQKFVYTAPLLIVCCANPDAYSKVTGMDDSNKDRALRDVSIASSYLMLRATELGLGTCYIGWVNKEKIKDILSIPKNYVVPYVITVGYPDEKSKGRSRKNLKEVIHWEKY